MLLLLAYLPRDTTVMLGKENGFWLEIVLDRVLGWIKSDSRNRAFTLALYLRSNAGADVLLLPSIVAFIWSWCFGVSLCVRSTELVGFGVFFSYIRNIYTLKKNISVFVFKHRSFHVETIVCRKLLEQFWRPFLI